LRSKHAPTSITSYAESEASRIRPDVAPVLHQA
jgi:hypothetical protein